MNSRLINILQQLLSAREPITSAYLAANLQVSSKTVQNCIKELNLLLAEADAKVESQRGIGYKLMVKNEAAFKQFLLERIRIGNQAVPTDPKDRIRYVMEKLLLQSDYIKMEDLACELYISRSTLKGDLKEVREILRKYELSLDQRPNYGIKVVGDEMKIRFLMSQYVFNQTAGFVDQTGDWLAILPKRELEWIKNSILSNIRKNKVIISDISLHNLITHIAIACKRIREENTVQLQTEELKTMQNKKEFVVAKAIVKDIEKKLNVIFPDNEVAYISIHLQGTKLVNPKVKKDELHTLIDQGTQNMAKFMTKKIDNLYPFNLSEDEEFLMALCLHLKPAVNRFKYKMNLRNPLLEEIKSKYPLSFEAALIGAEALKGQYGIAFDENEVGYIALHIEVAQERRKKKKTQTKKCLIVCASGLGTAQLLLYKLQNRFSSGLDIVGTTEYYNLKEYLSEDIDFIISTIPINDSLGIPVVQVSTLLGETDVKQIEKLMGNEIPIIDQYMRKEYTFLQFNFETKEEVIRFLGERLMNDGKVGPDYVPSVLEREAYSPTSFGNLVAIPHPIDPQTDETFWTIVTLKNPVQWGTKPVQFVCLLNIDKRNKQDLKPMYNVLMKILDNINLIQKILHCQTYEELKKALKEE